MGGGGFIRETTVGSGGASGRCGTRGSGGTIGSGGTRGFIYSPHSGVGMSDYFNDGLLDDVFIRDLDVLKPEYQPEEIDERGDEMDTYVNHLSPILKGWSTDNIFLFGESGVGKTLSTRILLPELRQKAEDNGVDVDIVETNCSGSSSSYQATISLINEMYSPTSPLTTLNLGKEELNNTGYPSSMVYSKLFDALDEGGDYLILVLDEIDGIGTDGELLYQLTRGQSMGKLDAEVCIVGISNDLYFKNNLKTSVKDTLCESEIHFPVYDSDDLQSILKRRSERAFYDETLEGGVISLCAALATKEHGSARYAIRWLRKAARLAEDEVRDGAEVEQVTEDHVRKAKSIIEAETVETGIKKLSESQRYLLLAVANAHAHGATPAKTPEIFSTYTDTVEQEGRDPLSRRGAHNNLRSMVDKGIIEIQNNARNQRGVSNEYALVTDIETIKSALESAEDSDMNLSSLLEQAKANGQT